ncbi:MAG: oligoendopeptidase F [bacterium]
MRFFQAETNTSVKAIPTRAELKESDKWDLTPLYSNDETWTEALSQFRAEFPQIKKFRGTLGQSAEAMLACLEFEKTVDLKLERLQHYASLQTAEDSSNDAYLKREGQLQHWITQWAEAASFVNPEIQAIGDERFESFLQAECLRPWVTQLRRLRRFRPHTLSHAEERLLALGDAALEGCDEAFSQLTNVDMKFGFLRNEKGEKIELSHGAFSSFLQKRDPKLRRKAFSQYYQEFDDHKFSLAATLATSVKADVFHMRARNYSSSLESALFPDAVPVAVYDNLIQTVRRRLPVLHHYYNVRRRLLGLKKIHLYDTYVPLVKKIEKRTTFDEAVELVLAALKPLGEEYVSVLGEGLRKSRWCDRYETKGKRSGAFSSSSYGNPPYILMNYKEDVFAEVYTLAHEAGHSMHSWFSQKHQSFQDHHYPIFLAEVASTFNEELLTHYLLENTDDRDMRAYLINRQIDDIRSTLHRQTMFAEFEKITHEMGENGEALTLETFRAVYRKLLDAYFGPRFCIDEELELECLRIPHFYGGFYVYKYATGISAALALARRVLQGGKEELRAYLKFLQSGGSRYPLETLAAAGVEMSTPAPIEAALQLFEQRVEELEKLLG